MPFRTIIEPFRIHSVEPFRITTEQERGAAGKRGIEVEFMEGGAAVIDGSFGIIGFIPLWIANRIIRKMSANYLPR